MKIIIFGASGGTGRHIVEQALAADHQVTAFVRTPAKLDLQHENLTVIQGDVGNPAQVEASIAGHEAVISALGPTKNSPPDMMLKAAEAIVAGMRKHGVKRLISTTGAGVRDPKDEPKLLDNFIKLMLSLLSGSVLRDSENNVNVIRGTDLDWTIVRYPMLTNGPRTSQYRVGYVGKNSGARLARADGAEFVLKELEQGKFVRQAPVVSY